MLLIGFGLIGGGFLAWLLPRLTPVRRWTLVGPFAVLQLTFLLYAVIGPAFLYLTTELSVIGIDLMESMGSSALAAVSSYIAMSAGYLSFRREVHPKLVGSNKPRPNVILYALLSYALFYSLTLVSVRFNLAALYNIFGSAETNMEGAGIGALQNYFYLSMSGMIAPIVLVLLLPGFHWTALAVLMALNATAVYVTTGFRIRVALVFLAASLAIFARNTLAPKGRIPFIRIIQVALAGLLLLASMSVARKYGKGVDRAVIQAASSEDMVSSFFKDTSIFYMGGKVVSMYQNDDRPHTYLETLQATVIRAIPSQIYGEKPLPATLEAVQYAMGGTQAARSSGFAVPFYIEYFIMFGWPGLIILSAFLGTVCAKFENSMSGDISLFRLLFHIMVSAYMFMYFHRGYMPQQVDYFFFIVGLPMLLLLPFRRLIG